MNVFYNFELDDDIEIIKKKPEIIIFTNVLREGIIERLMVLKDDIEKEEEISTRMTVITLPADESRVIKIEFMGYSDVLKKKMQECISPDYIQHLFNVSNDRFGTFYQ